MFEESSRTELGVGHSLLALHSPQFGQHMQLLLPQKYFYSGFSPELKIPRYGATSSMRHVRLVFDEKWT